MLTDSVMDMTLFNSISLLTNLLIMIIRIFGDFKMFALICDFYFARHIRNMARTPSADHHIHGNSIQFNIVLP